MSDQRRPKKNSLEVSSQSLQDELVAIKDRLSAIETLQSISNATVLKKYVEEHLTNNQSKKIMNACRSPKSKDEIQQELGFNSPQALNNHLTPLKEANLLKRVVREDGIVVFDWSNLFRSLPKKTINLLIGNDN